MIDLKLFEEHTHKAYSDAKDAAPDLITEVIMLRIAMIKIMNKSEQIPIKNNALFDCYTIAKEALAL